MAHFNEVLDVGIDYGAEGGPGWDTTVISYPTGGSRRNMNRSNALGAWQLGNRDVDKETLAYLQGFFHAMRGRAHTFLYLDWNDYEAEQQPLIIDGTEETQLTKSYGLTINGWVRDIRKPKADSVVIEYDEGGGFVTLEEGVDYELDPETGRVIWLFEPFPDAPDSMRWSGQFYVPARFDTDKLDSQFLALERRENGDQRAYSIGGLPIVEDPEA